jgi:hypothetical protein
MKGRIFLASALLAASYAIIYGTPLHGSAYQAGVRPSVPSVLASLNQEQFRAGLCRLRDYAAEHASTPVTKTIDYFAFQ